MSTEEKYKKIINDIKASGKSPEEIVSAAQVLSAGPSHKGGFEVKFKAQELSAIMAYHFGKLIDETGAENYVEMSFFHTEKGNITVTVQKPRGKTPHQLRKEAEELLAKERIITAELRQELESLKSKTTECSL